MRTLKVANVHLDKSNAFRLFHPFPLALQSDNTTEPSFFLASSLVPTSGKWSVILFSAGRTRDKSR